LCFDPLHLVIPEFFDSLVRQTNDDEASMRRDIRKVLRFVGVVGVVAVAAIVGAGVWFVVSHRTSVAASVQQADVEFSSLRARFADQQPLLDMSHREAAEPPTGSRRSLPLRTFHTVIFDTRGGQRLVRIDVPYWFARRFAGRDREFVWLGQLTFLDDTEFDSEPIRLSLDQVDRRGPGLVAYCGHQGGGRFISWVD